jgi:hypothetical protein
MKTNHTPLRTTAGIAALGVALLFTACSRDSDTTATTASSDPMTAPGASTAPGAATTTAMTDRWENLQTYSYDQRNEFAEKANDYAERLDDRIDDARGDASTRLAEARDELREAASEVSNATAETWEATKERVGRAWLKAESAAQSIAE